MSSVLGILVVGVIVGIVTMFPLYGHMKRVQEDHLMWILASKRLAIEEILSKAVETATKIAALPEVAEKLDNYRNAVIGRQELVEFTQAEFSSAVSYLPMVRAISIFDEQDHLAVQVGTDSAELLSQVGASIGTTFFGPTDAGGSRYFAVAVPIYDKAGRKIGTTVVTFRISDLEKAVKNHRGLGPTGKTIFGTVEHHRLVPILQSTRNSGSDSQSLSTESAFELAIRRTALKQTGILIPGKDHHGTQVVAYAPIGAGQWGIAVKMDKSELYAPVFPHIMITGGIISVLIIVGTLGTLLLVHPLTGKMVIRADELEQEVQEKVKIIDNLYEHIVQSEKSKAIAQHTAEVAHELRQPLAIIGGFARRMVKHFDSQGTCGVEQKEPCRIIISEIQRLEQILGGLIDFTKKRSLRMQKIDPNDVIQNVINVYESNLMEKVLRLEASLADDVSEVALDAGRLEQVVRNLLSNAMDASPAGETIHVQTRVYVPSEKARQTGELESESYFEMMIHNHGPVIPPEHLQGIFSPLFTTKDGGNGLGLTVTKKIVEDHKGSISVKSDEEGTVFTVWFPVEQEPLERIAD